MNALFWVIEHRLTMGIVFQTAGGAMGISAAQCGFVNQLIAHLRTVAPHIDPEKVINTGSTAIRDVFAPEDLAAIISSYMAGLRVPFGLMTAFGGMAFAMSLLQSWRRLPGTASEDKVSKV